MPRNIAGFGIGGCRCSRHLGVKRMDVRFLVLLLMAAAVCSCSRPTPRGPGLRVVSLHDVTTEIAVALGASKRLVGIGEPVDLSESAARAVEKIERVGSLESIFSVHPQIVLGLGVVAEQDPELVKRLKSAGVDVYLPDPETLDDVQLLTRSIAQRVAAPLEAEQILTQFRAAAARTESRPAHRVRVFVYDCCDPPFTAGKKTVLTDLIARAGGQNVFADLDADWTHVSWEEAVARRPELIVIHAYQHDGQADVADKLKTLRAIPSLGRLPTAVMPLGCSLGGLRSIEGLERLRRAIREHS
jgi:iron complex transport system substrate-binding protein